MQGQDGITSAYLKTSEPIKISGWAGEAAHRQCTAGKKIFMKQNEFRTLIPAILILFIKQADCFDFHHS